MITEATSHVEVEAGVEGKERGIRGREISVCVLMGREKDME